MAKEKKGSKLLGEFKKFALRGNVIDLACLLYTSPSPRD